MTLKLHSSSGLSRPRTQAEERIQASTSAFQGKATKRAIGLFNETRQGWQSSCMYENVLNIDMSSNVINFRLVWQYVDTTVLYYSLEDVVPGGTTMCFCQGSFEKMWAGACESCTHSFSIHIPLPRQLRGELSGGLRNSYWDGIRHSIQCFVSNVVLRSDKQKRLCYNLTELLSSPGVFLGILLSLLEDLSLQPS